MAGSAVKKLKFGGVYMIKPIVACVNPFETSKKYKAAGWNIDFVQLPESGDPLVGVSLFGNVVLLGITEGYLNKEDIPYIGCGVEFYLTVPKDTLEKTYLDHKAFSPSPITEYPWGNVFEVKIENCKYMITEAD